MSKIYSYSLVALFFAAGALCSAGVPARVANTQHYIGSLPPSAPEYTLTPVFAVAPFNSPQALAIPPAPADDRVFVGLRNGEIWWYDRTDPAAGPTRLLTGRGQNYGSYDERGILGLTLHPDFATNGYLYLYEVYTSGGKQARIKRFTADPPTAATIDPATQLDIYAFTDENIAHMGGGLKFGPDGYLYFTYGDGRNFCSTIENLQSQRGKIFRIDVDGGTPYAIPPTNPQAADPVRPELWALGFRNPFRISFDAMTGDLYLGDVGDRRWEEINLIVPGAHYGWPYYEAEMCHIFTASDCMDSNEGDCSGVDPNDFTFPLLKRQWDPDKSMTAGYVYYGAKFPELYGAFIYGDYTSTRVGAFRHDGATAVEDITLLPASGVAMVNIEPDQDGEPLLLDIASGNLFTLERAPIGSNEFPLALSQAPWLIDLAMGGSAEGVMPYAVNSRLWSDFAEKTRFMAIPNLDQIGYRPDKGYDLPTSATLIKNFYLETTRNEPATRRVIETRLLVRHGSGWAGYTYEWNDAGTDAALVAPNGKLRDYVVTEADGLTTRVQTWYYPARGDCFQCHTAAQNIVLGLETAQLNRDFDYDDATANQLERWEAMGFFTAALPAPPAGLPALADPLDTAASLEDRARAYVHANCAMCHQELGTTNVDIDMRYFIARAAMGLIDVPATTDFLPGLGQIPGLQRVKSGDETLSALYLRITGDGTAPYRMPPLARNEIDPEGTAMIRDWIRSLGADSSTDPVWLRHW